MILAMTSCIWQIVASGLSGSMPTIIAPCSLGRNSIPQGKLGIERHQLQAHRERGGRPGPIGPADQVGGLGGPAGLWYRGLGQGPLTVAHGDPDRDFLAVAPDQDVRRHPTGVIDTALIRWLMS